MRKTITLLLTLLMVLSLAACGDQTPIEDNDDQGGQVEIFTPVGEETEQPEENKEPVEDETPGKEDNTTVEEDDTHVEDEEEPSSFSPYSLTVWGLSEPPFAYEFVGYYVVTNGLSANGIDPNLVPRFIYRSSSDFATAQAYAELVSTSGWGGFIPDAEEEHPFGYTGQLGDFKILIRWEEGGTVTIKVTDLSKLAFWDDNVNAHVVSEYGEYGSYGEYDAGLEGC